VGIVGRLREKLVDVLISMVKPLAYIIGILTFPLVLLCIASIEVALRLNKFFKRVLHLKPVEEDLSKKDIRQEAIQKLTMTVVAVTIIFVSVLLHKLTNVPYILTTIINAVGLIILFYVMCWAIYILLYIDSIPSLKEN
jgi:hypothetical protein